MTNEKIELYVITGGPGVGKTTLIHKLRQADYITVEEDARKVIQQQIAIDGNGLPWKDKVSYARLMFNSSIKTFQEVSRRNHRVPVFFDRGVLDAVCYMHMEKIPLFDEVLIALNKVAYNKNIFILPPWKEIYHTDDERKQSWPEAVLTFYKMKETYLRYGYHVIEVPKVTVSDRVDFIIDRVK